MQPTMKRLGRIAGSTLAGAGALFIAVQINHPELTLEFVGSREFLIRESCKMLMAGLAAVGVLGLTAWHGRRIGALGVVAAVIFGTGYLAMLIVQAIAAFVLPAIVATSPDYVRDVLTAALGGRPASDIGGLQLLALGILGEYIGKIYMEVKHRPRFVIERVLDDSPAGETLPADRNGWK